MEFPYPERRRVGITHYRSYHFIYCSQKPGASQWWELVSLKFREPAASVTVWYCQTLPILLHNSANTEGFTFIGPSWFPGKYIPDHCTTFFLPASLSKLYTLVFITLHFFKSLLTQALLHPVSLFFSCSDKSRIILKGLNMLWTHGRRVTLLTAEGGCFLEQLKISFLSTLSDPRQMALRQLCSSDCHNGMSISTSNLPEQTGIVAPWLMQNPVSQTPCALG